MRALAWSKRFAKKFVGELGKDEVLDVAAMMAYYAIFALFPMLVFVVTIALLVVPTDVIQQGVDMATRTLPADAGRLIADQVSRMEQTAGAGFAVLGAVVALWGASRGANALGIALNKVFDKKETRPWWKRQLIAIAVTLGVALLIVVALGLLVVGPLAGHAIADRFGLGAAFDTAWNIGRWFGAALLVMVVWAFLYKFLPNTDAPFKILTPGAVLGVLLWVGVSQGFAVYLRNFGDYEATYGTLAAAIIFLLWLWLSNLALLVGAEVNDVLADFRKDESEAAAQLADPTEKGEITGRRPAGTEPARSPG